MQKVIFIGIRIVVLLSVIGLWHQRATAQTYTWPGQNGNAVGYGAYLTGTLGTSACSAPTSGSSWTSPTIISSCKYSTAQAISQSFVIFVQVDFDAGTSGTSVSGSNLLFIGCRFQSNSVANYNISVTGTNVYFIYPSVTPRTTFYTSPPGSTWPSAGAGQNTTSCVSDTLCTNGNDGYQYGFNITSGGPVTIANADIWGFGNSVVFYSTSTQMNVLNSWIHDAADASPQSYHTDGPGYLNSGAGPNHVWIVGNTIASLGNTNGIAFQAATSGYSDIQNQFNYLSGFGYTDAFCQPGTTACSNSAIYGDTWGTDIEPVFGPQYSQGWTGGTNSVWACNKLKWLSGTTWTDGDSWTPTSAIDGKYWIPAAGNSASSATDNGSNTVCGYTSPATLIWTRQTVSTSSITKQITLTSSNSGSLTISSIALQTGTQFSQTNNCPGTLTSGSSCTITVTFTPTTYGPQSDNLQITDNSPAPTNVQNIPLLGVGSTTTDQPIPTGTPTPALFADLL